MATRLSPEKRIIETGKYLDMTIQQVIDVPLERPREADDVDTTEFLTIKREIRSSLAI